MDIPGDNILQCDDMTQDYLANYICDEPNNIESLIRSVVYDRLKSIAKEFTPTILGCDAETFKKHIESQFSPDMNWDNHGSVWHVDHIIPLKYEVYTGADSSRPPTLQEIIHRFHYLNCQPLYADVNMSKGNRYIGGRDAIIPNNSTCVVANTTVKGPRMDSLQLFFQQYKSCHEQVTIKNLYAQFKIYIDKTLRKSVGKIAFRNRIINEKLIEKLSDDGTICYLHPINVEVVELRQQSKHEVETTENTAADLLKHNPNVSQNPNSDTINWLSENPPIDKEKTFEYYNRYCIATVKPINKIVFGRLASATFEHKYTLRKSDKSRFWVINE